MLSTLFPYLAKPRFGTFVEKRAQMLSTKEGIEVRVVAPVGLPPMGLGMLARYADKRATPHEEIWQGLHVYRPRFAHIPGVSGRFDPDNMVRALKPLLTKIREEFAFDVIDAQFFFPDAVAAASLGEYFNVPATATARGGDIHYWGEQPPARKLILAASEKLSGMIAVSQALRADMIKMGMNGDKIDVVRPGVDRNLFMPRDALDVKSKLGIEGNLIVTVGSLDENKGQYLVLDALAALPDIHYLIAGEGPMRGALERKIVELGLQDRARLLGNVDRNMISDLMAAADIMVMPSANEGLANAWLEALASGTPVVICMAGGAAEVVTSDVQGRIVERNPDALAQGIKDVLAQENDRQEINDSVGHFNWDRKIGLLHDHLLRLIDRK